MVNWLRVTTTTRIIIVTVLAMVVALGQVPNGLAATAAVIAMQADCSESASMDGAEMQMGSSSESEPLQDETGLCQKSCGTICVGTMMVLLDGGLSLIAPLPVSTGPHLLSLSLTPHPVDFITPPPRA